MRIIFLVSIFIQSLQSAAGSRLPDVCRIFGREQSRLEIAHAISDFKKDPFTIVEGKREYLAKSLGAGTCATEDLYFTQDKTLALRPATYGNPATIPMICGYNGCGFGSKLWPFKHADHLYVLLTDQSLDENSGKPEDFSQELAVHVREIYQLNGSSLKLTCTSPDSSDAGVKYPDLIRGNKENCAGVNLGDDLFGKEARKAASEPVKDTPPKLLSRLRAKNVAYSRTKTTFEGYQYTLSKLIESVDGQGKSGRILFTSLSSTAGVDVTSMACLLPTIRAC